MSKNLHIVVTTILFLFSGSLSNTHAQVAIGIRAGLNMANVRLVDEQGQPQDTEAIPRLHVGLTVDIPFASDTYLQPAVLYTGKGFQQDGGWLATSGNEFKAKAAYVEVPVNVLYKPRLGIGRIVVGAGPYVGYGTGGNWEAEGRIAIGDILLSEDHGDLIFKKDVMDGEFGNYLYGRPWDYGANVLIGYEFLQRLTLNLQAQLGIANLNPKVGDTARDGSIRNQAYGVSMAYRF